MALIDAETLKGTLGQPATGPAGFGLHYKVTGPADISTDATSVDTELDDQSLKNAHARNEGGSNKEIAALHPKKPATGSALSFVDQKMTNADSMYANMFAKHGLHKAVSRSISPLPTRANSPNRAQLSKETIAKNPLMRLRQRELLALRKTFDNTPRKKSIALNPESLPQQAKDKMIEAALQKGERATPLGELQATGRMIKATAKAAANPFNKWAALGALASGSFIDLAPRLKQP